MSDEERKSYDGFVLGWLDSKWLAGKRTAFIHPDTLLASPQASLRALVDLVNDGHRVIVGRKKAEPENG